MTSAASRPARSNGSEHIRDLIRSAILCAAVLAGTAVLVDAAEPGAWRTQRRTALKSAPSSQPFGLLVVPVDFDGERLPRAWDPAGDLAVRLAGDGPGSLRHYYATASGGALDLRIVLTPLVHLEGTPGDYSDLGLNGYTRTRALAAEALSGAAAAGLDFARADLLTAGGERGWVDGVLVLHAAPGLENDPVDGRVVPLQFFLEEPVRAGGAAADVYAVASLRSRLGIWAHETGHLLGLDDRYDTSLSSAGDTALSRGGLGVFSLMAAGAWGPGFDGAAPALLDAYSALQLGWQEAATVVAAQSAPSPLRPGAPLRFELGPGEYFLVETRGGAAAAPYDAVLPAPRVLVYHVDEAIPDDATGGTPPHLRVRLVEADGDAELAAGATPGEQDDVFGTRTWDVSTLPSSDGYGGPSGVSCTFAVDVAPVLIGWSRPAAAAVGVFDPLGEPPLRVTTPGRTPAAVSAVVRILGAEPRWGEFLPGGDTADFTLILVDGVWLPSAAPAWVPDGATPPGATTRFELVLTVDGVAEPARETIWLWGEADAALALPPVWPGAWSADTAGGGGTVWVRRPGGETGLPSTPLLACAVVDGAAWPDVRYANGDDAVLLSPRLVNDGRLLRLLHHLDLHAWEHAVGDDGAVIEALLPDGTVFPLAPVHGYDGRVSVEGDNVLLGRAAFTGAGELDPTGAPVFRIDLIDLGTVPSSSLQLRFRLASDGAWRGRGWLIAELAAVTDPREGTCSWTDDGRLRLGWSGAAPDLTVVELSTDGGGTWYAVWDGEPFAGGAASVARAALRLPFDPPPGSLVRARLVLPVGETVLRPVLLDAPTAPPALALSPCAPNPAPGYGRFDVTITAPSAVLRLHDLRGRLLRRWDLPVGEYRLEWDGRDDAGRRLPTGAYLFRLEAPGASTVRRKVVLIR
jgi:M6 family metalloprotease-like protein